MNYIRLVFFLFFLAKSSFSQNLMNEMVRDIAGQKRSVYVTRGIFYHKTNKINSILNKVRHHHYPRQMYERLVFDFDSNKVPKVYGHIGSDEKKISVDFFSTMVGKKIGLFGDSKYLKEVKFYPMPLGMLSVDIFLKENYSVDVFYLKNPGRLVIDIKK